MSSVAPAMERVPYPRRALAWAFYDWANSAVVTLIIAAVFPVFYNSIAEKSLGDNAASAFSFTISIGLLISAMVGPVLGTLADITGKRKRFLIIATIIGALCAVLMFTIQDGGWVWASVLFIVVQVLLNASLGLYDSLLSHVAPESRRDRLSALGYALGYIGGGLQLAVSVYIITAWEKLGFASQMDATKVTIVMAGVWWLLFAMPLFFVVPEPAATPFREGTSRSAIRDTFARLRSTLRAIRGYSELFKMLLAFLVYSEGIGTIIQLATTYGRQEIGLDQTTLIGALLLTQFAAFPFALMFGRLPDENAKNRDFYFAFIVWTMITFPLMGSFAAVQKLSTNTTFIYIAVNQVVGLIFCWFVGRKLATPYAQGLTTKRAILFGLGVYTVIACWGFFLYTAAEFWMLAYLVATVQGGTQALSRSLYSQLSPRSKSGEFFGFYGFSDKFAGVLGPMLFGLIGLGGNLRPAILSVIIFFVLGGLLLTRVNEVLGRQHAIEEDHADHYPEEPSK